MTSFVSVGVKFDAGVSKLFEVLHMAGISYSKGTSLRFSKKKSIKRKLGEKHEVEGIYLTPNCAF